MIALLSVWERLLAEQTVSDSSPCTFPSKVLWRENKTLLSYRVLPTDQFMLEKHLWAFLEKPDSLLSQVTAQVYVISLGELLRGKGLAYQCKALGSIPRGERKRKKKEN